MTEWLSLLHDETGHLPRRTFWILAGLAPAAVYILFVTGWWALATLNTNVLPDTLLVAPPDLAVWVRRPLLVLALVAGVALAARVVMVTREHWPAEPSDDDEPQDAPTTTPPAAAPAAPVPQPAPRKSGYQVPDYARASDVAVQALGGQATTAEIFARLKSSGALARLYDPPKDAIELGNMLKKMGWANRRQARYPEYGYPEPTRLRFHEDYVKAEAKYPWGVID